MINLFHFVVLSSIDFSLSFLFFFFNDTATTEIYTLSLHDALPISSRSLNGARMAGSRPRSHLWSTRIAGRPCGSRSEEHTSELQSHSDLVCRLLLEKKKKNKNQTSMALNPSTTTHYKIL